MIHQLLKTIWENRRVQNAVTGGTAASCTLLCAKLDQKWKKENIRFFYNQLSPQAQLAIQENPQKQREFLRKCEDYHNILKRSPMD